MERLPSLYPMPRDAGQYRAALAAAMDAPDRQTFLDRLGETIRRADEQPYSPSMVSKIEGNLLSIGFLDKDGSRVKLPLHVGTIEDARGFRDYVRNTIRRWPTRFHDGLTLAIDLLAILDQTPKAEKAIYEALVGTPEKPGRYDGSDTTGTRTIREMLKLLTLAEWAQYDGRAYTIGTEGSKPASDLRTRDPLHRAEMVLQRVDPAETGIFTAAMKIDLAKYYIYRQCGGKGRSEPMERAAKAIFVETKETLRNGVLARPRLRPEITTELKRVGKTRDALKAAIRAIDRDLGDQVKGFRSVAKLQAIKEAAQRGDLQQSEALAAQSGASFSWETLRLLKHSGPNYSFNPNFKPHPWQLLALDRWQEAQKRGVLAVVTGAGKTVFALLAMAGLAKEAPSTKFTILVPTKVLMYQWARELVRVLGVPPEDIGLRGDGHKDSFSARKRVMVVIVNSAIQDNFLAMDVKSLPTTDKHCLVADECHRYLGEEFQKAFECRMDFSLGLSATPAEAEDDRQGMPVLDVVQKALGRAFFTYTYRQGLDDRIIQPFVVHYVAVDLLSTERLQYDAFSKKISKALEKIRQRYGPRLEAMRASSLDQKLQILLRDENPDPAIFDYFTFVRERKNLVFGSLNRKRSYLDLITRHTVDKAEGPDRVIVFHERIEHLEEIVAPFDRRKKYVDDDDGQEEGGLAKYREAEVEKKVDQALVDLFLKRDFKPVMYHSGHARPMWNEVGMSLFRADIANVMLSVKALVEGVDVPQANVGIIRASSSSVRQRIQTIGRILRRATGKEGRAVMYVIYVRNTNDERIFRDTDWNEQLGNSAIESSVWLPPESDEATLGNLEPVELPEPISYEDDQPPLDVDASALKLGDAYPGRYGGTEFHVDAKGRPYRRGKEGRQFIANAEVKTAADFIRKEKGGGKFVVTPQGHLVTKLPDGLFFLGTTGPLTFEKPAVRKAGSVSFEDLFR